MKTRIQDDERMGTQRAGAGGNRAGIPGFRPLTRHFEAGWMTVDLVIAVAMLTLALLPLAYSYYREQRLFRAYYHRAIAMELVDGEMEVLAAGGWRDCPAGTHPYAVKAWAARNLPPGRFLLTRGKGFIRLEWVPRAKRQGGRVVRETPLP